MAEMDLLTLLHSGSEELGIEYKAWMDLQPNEARAELAKDLAALCNHGGGYLIFGVDDETRRPLGPAPMDLATFNEDAIAGIVKRYLDPPFQCRVQRVEEGGAVYPVVIVPQHGTRPVVAKSDGPQDAKNRVVGVRQGVIYIRDVGPASVPIARPEAWTALLERCLAQRADLLANIMRQAINRPAKASSRAADLLKAACRATEADFTAQSVALIKEVTDPRDKASIGTMPDNHVVLGYALVGSDGELLQVEDPRGLNTRVSVAMRRHAYRADGWSLFLPLTYAQRAPRTQTGKLGDDDHTFLEGMRLDTLEVVQYPMDYWRIYDQGLFCVVESYREDHDLADGKSRDKHLVVVRCLIKLHSVLAHARLVGQEMPALAQIVFHMDWRGLKGRSLILRDMHDDFTEVKAATDRFFKTITLSWAEVRDDYFGALKRICVPFFGLFASRHDFEPEQWLTRDRVEQLFARYGRGMRLFEQ
jgi:Putative DNA-binding domain